MTPPSQMGVPQGAMFGGSQQQPDSNSAARQIISEVAPITSALSQLAQSHQELAETVDICLQALKKGLMDAISQMQSQQGNQAGTPQYG
jgi:hypothetical protein